MKPLIKETYVNIIKRLDLIADPEARRAEIKHGSEYTAPSANGLTTYNYSTFTLYYHRAMNRLKREEGLIS